MYGKEIKKVLISKEDIAKRVAEIGELISKEYEGELHLYAPCGAPASFLPTLCAL